MAGKTVKEGMDAGMDAQSSNVPEGRIAELGHTHTPTEKVTDSFVISRDLKSKETTTARSSAHGHVQAQMEKKTENFKIFDGEMNEEGERAHERGGPKSIGVQLWGEGEDKIEEEGKANHVNYIKRKEKRLVGDGP